MVQYSRMSSGKQEIRARAREVRAAIPAEQRVALSRAIREQVLALLDGTDPVLVYASKPPEVDTLPLISTMISRGTRVVVPIIEKEERTLRLSYLDDAALLSVSTFSVPEPIGHEVPADPGEIPVVIVPMIAYDAKGHRLGYGAGYYDRFLSRYPHMRKVGVAFSCQEVDSIPADENDVCMDIIVTECGITWIKE
ncbi:MAG: 5-formyltetrahydrofolate cyclo-ligase family protein [Methanoregulaceae archaeon PtaB.Bin009]|jgi:5-formyltetrahydrofolate cyclo-ligase|nr:MAG: 5-formyltetrahydrofolate cyclo-ligase family protein [Methanoregulaceae archaeon PtaB.Bin009]OPY39219.1 MAG: 5-formyltetrahydrofolate cyclo-ligase family protein [Methanoregulaceae archaeon PtaU1.Bin066]